MKCFSNLTYNLIITITIQSKILMKLLNIIKYLGILKDLKYINDLYY